MSHHHLNRDDAPFGDEVWEKIDEVVVGAARSRLAGRRILHADGPYGIGLKVLPTADRIVQESDGGVATVASGAVPLAQIVREFPLSARDIAAFTDRGVPMELGEVACAALECATREDELVFNGSDALGWTGLMNSEGALSVNLSSWEEPGTAANDIIGAVTALDDAGLHGPYTLALSAERYNLLYRRYMQGNQTEIEHIRVMISEGVVKAPALESGGVLLASGRQYAHIVLGADLTAGFIGPAGANYEFFLTESLAPRVLLPQAVCILKEA
jgi:uncharacterized linocin/CFP29 family protein